MLILNTKTSIVRPAGAYPAHFSDVKQGLRTPFGAADGAKAEEPCLNWYFFLDCDKDVPEDEQQAAWVQTGTDFGGRKAACTKMVNNIVGRNVTQDEVKRLDITRLIGQRMTILYTVEQTDEGPRNKIAGISREDGTAMDITPLLLPEGVKPKKG